MWVFCNLQVDFKHQVFHFAWIGLFSRSSVDLKFSTGCLDIDPGNFHNHQIGQDWVCFILVCGNLLSRELQFQWEWSWCSVFSPKMLWSVVDSAEKKVQLMCKVIFG